MEKYNIPNKGGLEFEILPVTVLHTDSIKNWFVYFASIYVILCFSYYCIYRKIPIISPGLILFQRPFLPENNR